MTADPRLLVHALTRAGITATVDGSTGTVVLVCDQTAADDLAERVLRTVPLRGPHEEPPLASALPLVATSRVVLDTDPDHPAVMAALGAATPRVTVDDSLAVVPRTRDGAHRPDTRDPAACTCMASVLTCALHGNPTGPPTTPAVTSTLPQAADLPTQPEAPASGQGDPDLDVTGGVQ